jgi:riboflavin kinase/FMN adenylyltransferase
LLAELGSRLGFDVVGLGLLDVGGGSAGPVSSTAIRGLLDRGDVAGAIGLLGRPYEMRGVVRPGDRRGRELGFPTANIAVPPAILLPADGVYAGWYERPDGAVHQAALSVGHRPTFHESATEPVLEAFLLDFDGDLYEEQARVRFVSRLRAQERFGSTDELVTQTARDVEIAREVLTG